MKQAAEDYQDHPLPTGYDDSPRYVWDSNFKFDKFDDTIKKFNGAEATALHNNIIGSSRRFGEPILSRRIDDSC